MKILLTVDGSSSSDDAVEAVAQRPWPKGSEVRIFSAAVVPARLLAIGDVISPHFAADLEQAARAQAEAVVSKATGSFRERIEQGFTVTTVVAVNSAIDGILKEAEHWDADLIVMGSHGYGGYRRFLLGSVSQAIASLAKCSVEIVRRRGTSASHA